MNEPAGPKRRPPSAHRSRARTWWIAAATTLALALGGYAAWITLQATLPPVARLARWTPRSTALMRARVNEARTGGRAVRIDQRWVPYERISPLLRHAVLIAEDDAFFSHGGLDWHEIRESARVNLKAGRVLRGGSTITQQLARNLYLGNERSLGRKLGEAVLALRLERACTKRRIFELYLNLIEWGDGIFGIQAAAERHFGVGADQLSPRQAALLAAVIVNPRRYSPVAPGRRIERRMRMILGRMARRGLLTEDELRVALAGEPERPMNPLEWLFGAPADTTPTAPSPAPVDSAEVDTANAPGEPGR